MKALRAIGWGRALRHVWYSMADIVGSLLPAAPLRAAWFRLLGARIGADTIVMRVRLFNADRGGPGGLVIGRECFVGDETLLDLAGRIEFGPQVTVAERVTILTHTTVGYADHPLQRAFPASVRPVRLKAGCFVGAGATLLPGVTVGERAFVAAGAVVTRDVPPRTLVAGVPARVVRRIR